MFIISFTNLFYWSWQISYEKFYNPPSGKISIEIYPLLGVNLNAFDKKFKNIWVYLASSPKKFLKNGSISLDM